MNDISATFAAALAADNEFQSALARAGYKSRWDWPGPKHLPASDPVVKAYNAKLAADDAHHAAWLASRQTK